MPNCPNCGVDLTALFDEATLVNRKWCSERCRKRALYSVPCAECGTPVGLDYRPADDEPPHYCITHSRAQRKTNMEYRARLSVSSRKRGPKYSDEQIIEALRNVHRQYGVATSHPGGTYDQARWDDPAMPSHSTVMLRFGSWGDALEAAGLTRNPSRPYQTRFHSEDAIRAVRACRDELGLGRAPTQGEYDDWSRGLVDYPCTTTVYRLLGGWDGVMAVMTASARTGPPHDDAGRKGEPRSVDHSTPSRDDEPAAA